MKCVNTGRFEGAAGHARIGAQSSDGIEQLAAVSNNRNAEVLQVLRRQVW
jgi:hypothetical protein